MEELKGALLRQQPDASLADEVKQLRAEVKRKLDIIHGLTAEKNMYTSELATMRVTQEVRETCIPGRYSHPRAFQGYT